MASGLSVVIGRRSDPHAAAVLDAAEGSGAHVVCLDAESLSHADFVIEPAGPFVVDNGGESVALRQGRGWLRRLAPEDWREGIAPEGLEAAVRQAWTTALTTLISLADLEWLTDLQTVFAAEDKLVQQRVCSRIGLSCPPSSVVTRRARIPFAFGDHLIVKPLAAGHYFDERGAGRVVHATAMDRSDERLDLLGGAPFIVQPRLKALAHLRVVTVRDQAWVAVLSAEGLPLDWRASDEAHSSFEAGDRDGVAADAVRLAAALGVGYSSQDWLIDHSNTAHFLDLNPAGQWLFLPDEVSDKVTQAIADWLLNR